MNFIQKDCVLSMCQVKDLELFVFSRLTFFDRVRRNPPSNHLSVAPIGFHCKLPSFSLLTAESTVKNHCVEKGQTNILKKKQ